MKRRIAGAALSFGVVLATIAGAQTTPRRDAMQPEVAISTFTDAQLAEHIAKQVLDHDSEVSRSEAVTAVVRIAGCQADAQGAWPRLNRRRCVISTRGGSARPTDCAV